MKLRMNITNLYRNSNNPWWYEQISYRFHNFYSAHLPGFAGCINQGISLSLILVKKQRKYIAWVFLIALSTIIVPRTYLHSIVHNEEEEHIHCTNQHTTQVGIFHEHCSFLQYSVPPIEIFVPDFHFSIEFYSQLNLCYTTLGKFSEVLSLPDLRGPPQF